jgi:hypothetical protein
MADRNPATGQYCANPRKDARALSLYAQGLTLEQISARLGCDGLAVTRALARSSGKPAAKRIAARIRELEAAAALPLHPSRAALAEREELWRQIRHLRRRLNRIHELEAS